MRSVVLRKDIIAILSWASLGFSGDAASEKLDCYGSTCYRFAPIQLQILEIKQQIEHEARMGVAKSQYQFGYGYKYGEERDDAQAFIWFRRAAEQGFAPAQYELGTMYAAGQGVQQDNTQAVAWYQKAAAQGNTDAQKVLNTMQANMTGNNERPVRGAGGQDAVQAVRRAAAQGLAQAQYNLGLMYAEGRGVQRDDVQAVAWYQKAAAQGLAQAQYNLGLMYAEGRGVQRDDVQAVAWYQKAAAQGFAQAQNNLGLMYAEGRGVQRDDVQAVAWLQKAAAQGFAQAQNNLRWIQTKNVREASAAMSECYAEGVYKTCTSENMFCRDEISQGTGLGKTQTEAIQHALKMCSDHMTTMLIISSFPSSDQKRSIKSSCRVTSCK